MTFKKVEQEETPRVNDSRKTVYTYAVNMIVSVFAEDQEQARKQLDDNGGFVSNRTVELKDAISLYHPQDHVDNK